MRSFVNICYRLVVPYLHEKRQSHRINLSLIGLPVEDLALDCIAELFERDKSGRFSVLVKYFEAQQWRDIADHELFEATRRLLFSAVNDNLYRNYREADPSLAKLIRNLKLAAQSYQGALHYVNGTVWIGALINRSDLTVMPPEFLGLHLGRYVRERVNTIQLFLAAVDTLRNQTLYLPAMPLVQLAHTIRMAMEKVYSVEAPAHPPAFRTEEIVWFIQESIDTLREKTHPKYVDSGKIDDETFSAYMNGIRERLCAAYGAEPERELTDFEALSLFLPGLSRATYNEVHRARFEYLSRRARDYMAMNIRREFARAQY